MKLSIIERKGKTRKNQEKEAKDEAREGSESRKQDEESKGENNKWKTARIMPRKR